MSHEIFFCICWLLRSLLFNIQAFGYFLVNILFEFSFDNIILREYIVYAFISFKFLRFIWWIKSYTKNIYAKDILVYVAWILEKNLYFWPDCGRLRLIKVKQAHPWWLSKMPPQNKKWKGLSMLLIVKVLGSNPILPPKKKSIEVLFREISSKCWLGPVT